MSSFVGYCHREAIQLCENISDSILRLEIFKEKARIAVDILRQQIAEIHEGGVEKDDWWRLGLLNNLCTHLIEVHGLEPQNEIVDAEFAVTDDTPSNEDNNV